MQRAKLAGVAAAITVLAVGILGTVILSKDNSNSESKTEIIASTKEKSSVNVQDYDDVKKIDITNDILTSTEPLCSEYVGIYTSMIKDLSNGNELDGSLEITADNNLCTFMTNQIPNHDLGENSHFANEVSENGATLIITSSPRFGATRSGLGMGASAIMLNGVKWEAYPAACYGVGNEPLGREAIGCGHDNLENPWRYNIGSNLNDFGFDTNFAHVQPGGLYHYHSTPTKLYEPECAGSSISPVVGFAADGYPVYGPCFKDRSGSIRPAISSYSVKSGTRQKVEGYTTPVKVGNVASSSYDGQFIGDHEFILDQGDLDICNGMTVNGQYGYYITTGYPYVLACHSGTPSTSFR